MIYKGLSVPKSRLARIYKCRHALFLIFERERRAEHSPFKTNPFRE